MDFGANLRLSHACGGGIFIGISPRSVQLSFFNIKVPGKSIPGDFLLNNNLLYLSIHFLHGFAVAYFDYGSCCVAAYAYALEIEVFSLGCLGVDAVDSDTAVGVG